MMRELARGNTKALKNVVEAVCAEADEIDDGMIDINVKSPSKQQRAQASKLDPGTSSLAVACLELGLRDSKMTHRPLSSWL